MDKSPKNKGREVEPLLVRPWPEGARMLGIGRATMYEKIARNELPGCVVRIGRSVRLNVEALRRWVEQQSA